MKYIYIIGIIGLFMPINTLANSIDEYFVDLGYSQAEATAIINDCKNSKNPSGCMKFASSIGKQESGAGKYDNMFGLMTSQIDDKSSIQQIYIRVNKYNKYRYKHKTSNDFLSKSKYCTEEPGATRGSGCPNWQKNVQKYADDFDKYIGGEKIDIYTGDNAEYITQTQKPKKTCKQIYTAQGGDYVQIDTMRGKFKQRLGLDKGDKIFVCR